MEHVAITVSDINWHIEFFADVLGMDILRREDDAAGAIRQVWLKLIAKKDKQQGTKGCDHLGIVVQDFHAINQLLAIEIK